MNFRRITAVLTVVSMAIIFSGCVVNQTIGLDYQPERTAAAAKSTVVSVLVQDARADVDVQGKRGTYLGTLRGGYGNTFNVTTKSKEDLATHVKRDLSADLSALGYKVSDDKVSRRVQVVIKDWKFDTYINTTYWYDIDVSVLDGQNRKLATRTLKESVTIEGSAWSGGKKALMKEAPNLYRGVIRKMVRENTEVLRALD